MKYTFLVVHEVSKNSSASRGYISHYQAGNGKWGKKECLPLFDKISVNLVDLEEAITIRQNFYYDYDLKKFIHKDTKEEFNSNYVIKEKKYIPTNITNEEVATRLNNNKKVINGCEFLRQKIDGDELAARKYLMKIFRKFRDLEDVKDLLTYIKYGQAGEITIKMQNLSQETKNKLIKILSKKDYDIFHNFWKVL